SLKAGPSSCYDSRERVDSQKPENMARGARCALHAGKPFVTLCSRCGTYMCQSCTEDGAFGTCAACRAQASPQTFPFSRESDSFFALVAFAFQAYRANWAVLTVALVISVTLTVGAQVLALSLPFLFGVGSSSSL